MSHAARPPARIYLLPGLDGTGRLFAPLLGALPAGAAQVITYPFEHPASWEALADLVATQVDTASPFVLFAESFSGPVAMRFLARHGSRCRALLACATFASDPWPWLTALATLPGALWLVPRRPPGWVLRRLLLSPDAGPDLTREVADVVASVPRGALLRRLRLIRSLTAETATFGFPVVYVRGSGDRLVGPGSEAELVARTPGCRVERVPGGHHLLAQEHPALVARLLLGLR